MAKAGITHDVRLTTSADGEETGLMLARTEGRAAYSARKLPELPSNPLTVEQSSWHLGIGDYLYRSNDPYRYAFSDGLDLRHANGVQVAPFIGKGLNDFLLRNGGGEFGGFGLEATLWSKDPDVTVTTPPSSTDSVRSGSFTIKMVTNGSVSRNDLLIYQDLQNHAEYQGKQIKVVAWIKAGDSKSLRLHVNDGVATVTSDSTSSGSYTYVHATITVNGSASRVRIAIENDSDGDDGHDHYVDDIHVIPTGGITPHAMAVYKDTLYMACGRAVVVWTEARYSWDMSFLNDAAEDLTSLVVHGGFLYAGAASEYHHFNGSAWTSVTPSAPSGPVTSSDFFTSALDGNGVIRAWRSDKTCDSANMLMVSSETLGAAVGAGDWNASTFAVGDVDKEITQLYGIFDTILVGKEDGLYYFYPPDDTFRPAASQFQLSPSTENFDHGIEYIDGFFYTTMARFGLVRLRFEQGDLVVQQVAPNYQASMYDQLGGRVRALAHDGYWLYGTMDTATADTTTSKICTVLAARNERTSSNSVELVWHTIFTAEMGIVGVMAVNHDKVFVTGQLYNGTEYVLVSYSMELPVKHINEAKEAVPSFEILRTRNFVTSIFDYAEDGFGQDDKGWLKVVIFADNVSSTNSITVEEQHDNGISDTGSWTAVGSAITSTTTNTATVSFASGTTGKRLRLRFSLGSSTSTTPILRGFRIYAIPSPDVWWEWEITCRIGTGNTLLNGNPDTETAKTVMARLETLRDQDFPLKFSDIDGSDSKNVKIVQMVKHAQVRKVDGPMAHAEHLETLVTLRLQEVLLS